MLICDKCNAKINQESKFCPQCGDPVDHKDIVVNSLENNIANVILTFGYSSSANYEKALSIFKNLPTYSFEGENKKIVHKVILPITEVDLIINIYDLIGSWKTSQMLINGKSCTKKDLSFYGIGCFKSRLEAVDKTLYCYGRYDYERNIWGCKKLGMPIYRWGGGWLESGFFDNKGIWHFDKKRIKADLDIAMKPIELCPILNKAKIYKALDLIPNTINPKTDENWEYDERFIEVNGEYKKAAKGIKPTINEIFYLIPDDEKPKWDFESDNINTFNKTEVKVSLEEKQENKFKIKYIIYAAIILFFIIRAM